MYLECLLWNCLRWMPQNSFDFELWCFYNPQQKVSGYIGMSLSVHLSVCASVHQDCIADSFMNILKLYIDLCPSYPLYSTYTSGGILSIFGTYDHEHEMVWQEQWHLILTYIYKVIQPWLCNKTVKIWHILWCLLSSAYSSGWILPMLCKNDGMFSEQGCSKSIQFCWWTEKTIEQTAEV